MGRIPSGPEDLVGPNPCRARKVGQFRDAVPLHAWNHVPTHLNPADLLSRGCKINELFASDLWWRGPGFLTQASEHWPEHGVPSQPVEPIHDERRLQRLIGIYTAKARAVNPKGESPFKHISNWNKACKIAAVCAEAARQWRNKTKKTNFPATATTVGVDLLAAMAIEQGALWPDEFAALRRGKELPARDPWNELRVMWKHGCIHVYGRATPEPLPFLNKTSHLALLWLQHIHEGVLQHAGVPRTLLVESRKMIWVSGATTLARKVVCSCSTCKTLEPNRVQQPEADQPSFRTGKGDDANQVVFSHVLVDECVPVVTRQGRGK